ncbi:MAG: hypothetical protein ACP5M9_04280 [Candidatus Micrarchaeia archaeon]
MNSNNSNEELETLFNKFAEEKKTRELISLPYDFYIKTESKIKKTVNEENEQENNTTEKNIKKLLEKIKKIRIQKILIYIAYERKVPSPLPKEEENLYITIKNILNGSSIKLKTQKILIKNDTPELITPEGKKLGPFRKDQYIDIQDIENGNELDFILKNKIGELIQE